VYVNGNPGRTDPAVRNLERESAQLSWLNPYTNQVETGITVALADPVAERALHMINADSQRTPTFTLFGHPDFFFTASATNPSCGGNPCVAPGFAWNHGDIQEEIGNTWLGFVGPGIVSHGIDAKTWTDHTNVRPTYLALLGLRDDYVADGRLLIETLDPKAVPPTLAKSSAAAPLMQLYEQLNAPFGQWAQQILAISTKALTSTDESRYSSLEDRITALTRRRDYLAGKIKTALARATFSEKAVNPALARKWLAAGRQLLADTAALNK
jgi:hypothetical protein